MVDCRAMDLWIDPIVEQYNDYQWYTVNRDELEDVVVENEVMGIPKAVKQFQKRRQNCTPSFSKC